MDGGHLDSGSDATFKNESPFEQREALGSSWVIDRKNEEYQNPELINVNACEFVEAKSEMKIGHHLMNKSSQERLFEKRSDNNFTSHNYKNSDNNHLTVHHKENFHELKKVFGS